MYVEYEFYTSLYGADAIKETEFNRLSWEACKKVDCHTTGVDGLKKLKHFFPSDKEDAEAVKRCVCKLIDTMQKVNLAEDASGYVAREDGMLQGKLVASVSAGNESISYSAGKNAINTAANDSATREKLYMDIITEYLSGVTDANGVNLLYMGVYPRRVI
jgi:hypothetical protein